MDFNGGKGNGFERIEYGDRRVGISGGIDDDAVEFAESLLDPIN